jgi:hypothetical protein
MNINFPRNLEILINQIQFKNPKIWEIGSTSNITNKKKYKEIFPAVIFELVTLWPEMKFIVKYIEEFCHMAGFYVTTTDRVRDQASLISHFDSNQMEWKIEINLDRQGRFNSRNGN